MNATFGVAVSTRSAIGHKRGVCDRRVGMTRVFGASEAYDGRATTEREDEADSVKAAILENKRSGTAAGYRRAAIKTGWTASGYGLFGPDDPVLRSYVNSPTLRPFEKHLPNAVSPYEPVPTGGFITGKEAIEQRGIDLRLFFDIEEEEIVGLVRFDRDKAAIGPGYTAHGGAISAVLDEATAEAGKMMAFPYLATRRITHEMKKPVPVATTLAVQTKITSVKGLRCYVTGEMRDPVDGTVFASAEAELVNVTPWLE